MKITLTYWDRKQLYQMLSNQEIGRAPLGKIQSMLQARTKIDPSDLETDNQDKKYNLTLSEDQIKTIYTLATNPVVNWPINERSSSLFERLEQAKNGEEEA